MATEPHNKQNSICRIQALTAGLCLLFLFSSSYSLAQKAPDFSLPQLLKADSSILSDHRGKIVYLDFWSAWCSPCRDSLPFFAKMANELPAGEFELISINVDRNPRDAIAFLDSLSDQDISNELLILSDPANITIEMYGIESLPTGFVINRRGQLIETHKNFELQSLQRIKETLLALIDRETPA